MNLAMPFTPKDLKRRYRELAKRHHPDRNPHKPGVAETMATDECDCGSRLHAEIYRLVECPEP